MAPGFLARSYRTTLALEVFPSHHEPRHRQIGDPGWDSGFLYEFGNRSCSTTEATSGVRAGGASPSAGARTCPATRSLGVTRAHLPPGVTPAPRTPKAPASPALSLGSSSCGANSCRHLHLPAGVPARGERPRLLDPG